MSQSDYLQRKRLGTVLNTKNQSKLQKTLPSEDYTLFKQYSLGNSIINTSNVYNQIVRPNSSIIFGMEITTPKSCPQYQVCNNTQIRPNRSILTDPIAFNPYVSSKPIYVSSYIGTDTGYTHNQNTTKTPPNPTQPCAGCCLKSPSQSTTKPQSNTNFTSSRMSRLKCIGTQGSGKTS